MKTLHTLQRAADFADRISECSGRIVAWFSLAMVVITFTVVVLRYGFNLGWIAMQESVLYLHASLLMLGSAYTLRHDAHVRVDVLYAHLDERGRAWVDFIGSLLFLLPVCGFIFWISLDYVLASWRVWERSAQAGGLPGVFLIKTLIPVTALALLLQGLALMVRAAQRLRQGSA